MGEKSYKMVKRNAFLETGFALFSGHGIESVTMQRIADESGYGVATLYRYYNNKPALVIAIAARKWEEYISSSLRQQHEDLTAAQSFTNFLDSFVDLYRNHRDLLRFNQFFNIYVNSESIEAGEMGQYQAAIEMLAERFHLTYEKAKTDHTLRTDIPEKVIFSTTLHLMLAAATRYAVGLIYTPEDAYDPETELITLHDALLEKYVR